MKIYISYFICLLHLPLVLLSQEGNVGIGGNALRAKLEVFGVAGAGNNNAVFGGNGAGISFQQNSPAIGFNQYRNKTGGYGHGYSIDTGYAAVEYMDPGTGNFAIDMSFFGGSSGAITNMSRAFTIFPTGEVSFGKGSSKSNLTIDYQKNNNDVNIANGSIYLVGTQYPSYINVHQGGDRMPTKIGPGKDNGVTYINDIPGNNVVIGGTGGRVGINMAPVFITTLNIRHPATGNGLLLIEQTSYNNWEWYVSNDNPVWIGQKYNGLLIGDYNPVTGEHGYVSDRRLKTAIHPLRQVLNKVMELKPVKYHMKNAPGSSFKQGFLANDVKNVFPEVVSVVTGNDNADKGLPDLHILNYSQFFVVAIKAIQEQQMQIAELMKAIDQLEKLKK